MTSARTTTTLPARGLDPLPLWVDGPAKRATLDAIDAAAREGATIDEAAPVQRTVLVERATLEGGHDGGVQRPMMELLRHVERRGFVTYVFTREDLGAAKARATETYGVASERVVEATSADAAEGEVERRLGARPAFVIARGRAPDEIAVTQGTKRNAATGSAGGATRVLAIVSPSRDFFVPLEIPPF